MHPEKHTSSDTRNFLKAGPYEFFGKHRQPTLNYWMALTDNQVPLWRVRPFDNSD